MVPQLFERSTEPDCEADRSLVLWASRVASSVWLADEASDGWNPYRSCDPFATVWHRQQQAFSDAEHPTRPHLTDPQFATTTMHWREQAKRLGVSQLDAAFTATELQASVPRGLRQEDSLRAQATAIAAVVGEPAVWTAGAVMLGRTAVRLLRGRSSSRWWDLALGAGLAGGVAAATTVLQEEPVVWARLQSIGDALKALQRARTEDVSQR
jgi:hypothetical protein